jgi:UDP-N-acetylglucosamine 1-carboxyvinyltransferase
MNTRPTSGIWRPDQIRIHGHARLAGAVTIAPSKNAFHKLIAACVAIPAIHRLDRVPLSDDARSLITMTESLGAIVELDTKHETLTLDSTQVSPEPLEQELTLQSTGSFLFAGALLGRFGLAEIGPPGGDQIGARPVDRHLDAFSQLGATVEPTGARYHVSGPLLGGSVRFARDTVNGTANAILAAVGARGRTVIEHASVDPDVLALVDFLRSAGATVDATLHGRVTVDGSPDFAATTRYEVPPDRNDAATFAIAGALCGGRVELRRIGPTPLLPLLNALEEAGVVIESTADHIVVRGDIWAGGPPLHIVSGPHPGFLTDWGPLTQVLMTRLSGVSSFHETVHSARFSHVAQLAKMGAVVGVDDAPPEAADYGFPDQSRDGEIVHIGGPTPLHGALVVGDNLRATAALLLAGLIADGETFLDGSEHLARGYVRLVERLRELGADLHE